MTRGRTGARHGLNRYVSLAEPAGESRFIVRLRGSLLVGWIVESHSDVELWPFSPVQLLQWMEQPWENHRQLWPEPRALCARHPPRGLAQSQPSVSCRRRGGERSGHERGVERSKPPNSPPGLQTRWHERRAGSPSWRTEGQLPLRNSGREASRAFRGVGLINMPWPATAGSAAQRAATARICENGRF